MMIITSKGHTSGQLIANGRINAISTDQDIALGTLAIFKMANHTAICIFYRSDLVAKTDIFIAHGFSEHFIQIMTINPYCRRTIFFGPVTAVSLIYKLAVLVVIQVAIKFDANSVISLF